MEARGDPILKSIDDAVGDHACSSVACLGLASVSASAGQAVYLEAGCSCGHAKLIVVRRERKAIKVVANEQGARQVDGVQRAQGRRKGLRSSLEHDRIQRHQTECVDSLQHICSVLRDLPVLQAEAHPSARHGGDAAPSLDQCAAEASARRS